MKIKQEKLSKDKLIKFMEYVSTQQRIHDTFSVEYSFGGNDSGTYHIKGCDNGIWDIISMDDVEPRELTLEERVSNIEKILKLHNELNFKI